MDRLNFRYPEQMKPLSQVVAWSILITLVFGIGAFYASKASAAQEAELWAVAHELIPVAEQYMGRPASGALPDMRIVEADEMPCLCAAVYVYAVDVQPAELWISAARRAAASQRYAARSTARSQHRPA